jgi:hypothetical protein
MSIAGAEHAAVRPTWDCAACGKPWPCDPAREQLAAELPRTYLIVYLSIDMVDAARDQPTMPPGELYERFIAWARTAEDGLRQPAPR